MAVLEDFKASSNDVLKIEHRTSEPFDHPIDPASLATIAFNVGEIAAVNASGFVVRADVDNLATLKVLGLFMLPKIPSDARKNNYVLASGNASIFSNGIVRLSTQISNASVSATDILYVGQDGKLTNVEPVDPAIAVAVGTALTSRTEATAEIRVKLEL